METVLTVATLTAAFRLAIPVAIAALGALISERAGVLNLGLEGMMLAGAFGGYSAAEITGSPWIGLVAGLVVGLACGLLLALFVVAGRSNQIVTGISFTLLAGFATTLLFQQQYSVGQIPPRVNRIGLPALIVVTVVVFAVVAFLLARTVAGLALSAIGESPDAADALGYDVVRTRTLAAGASGALAGLGGAMLVCGPLGLFIENVTAGRGWVALALVVFAGWRPAPALFGAFLFGLSDAVQLRLQGTDTAIPYEAFVALPYLVTLVGDASTGGAQIPNPKFGDWDLGLVLGSESSRPVFGIFLVTVALVLGLLVANLRRSGTGRRILAMRSNERAASAAGINVARVKLQVFAASAFIAGVAGTLTAYRFGAVSDLSFGTVASLTALAVAYLGGITSVSGAVTSGIVAASGVAFFGTSQVIGSLGTWEAFIGGLLLIITAILNPEGIAGAFRTQAAEAREKRAARRLARQPVVDTAQIPEPVA